MGTRAPAAYRDRSRVERASIAVAVRALERSVCDASRPVGDVRTGERTDERARVLRATRHGQAHAKESDGGAGGDQIHRARAKIDENVKRELVNHRLLTHPNIVRFIEAVVTEKHLAIVMEYAIRELFDRILKGEVRGTGGEVFLSAAHIWRGVLPRERGGA